VDSYSDHKESLGHLLPRAKEFHEVEALIKSIASNKGLSASAKKKELFEQGFDPKKNMNINTFYLDIKDF